jgi:hypothetical protein
MTVLGITSETAGFAESDAASAGDMVAVNVAKMLVGLMSRAPDRWSCATSGVCSVRMAARREGDRLGPDPWFLRITIMDSAGPLAALTAG